MAEVQATLEDLAAEISKLKGAIVDLQTKAPEIARAEFVALEENVDNLLKATAAVARVQQDIEGINNSLLALNERLMTIEAVPSDVNPLALSAGYVAKIKDVIDRHHGGPSIVE